MSHAPPTGIKTPVTCSALLSRLRKKSPSYTSSSEEQDSGFCTPGSGFLSFTSPESCQRRVEVPEEKVDFISQLGGGSADYFPVLSKILGYLRDEDVAIASRVCKGWNRAINGHLSVRTRLRDYLNRKISNVENEQELDKKSNGLLDQRLPLDSNNNKSLRLLNNITNVHSSQSKLSSNVPRAATGQTKFNIFCQEGEKLCAGEYLSHCPRCELPAKVTKQSSLARCVNKGCEYVFCTACLCPYSLDPPHACLLIPPTTPRSRRRYYTVSSKLNRANLKRLLR